MKSPNKINMEQIYHIQRAMHEKSRQLKSTKVSHFDGLEFTVLPNVFPPSPDSEALVRSMYADRKVFGVCPKDLIRGGYVLDMCTGSGHLAIRTALLGAKHVVAADFSQDAIDCAKANIANYDLEDKFTVIQSDVFQNIPLSKYRNKFDAILMNPPFTEHNQERGDNVERNTWDPNLHLHTEFFKNAGFYLSKDGLILMAHASFGAIDKMKELAHEHGYLYRKIGEKYVDANRTFYAYALKNKSG